MSDEVARIRKIVIASGNAHKIDEIGAMLRQQAPQLEVVGMKSFGKPPEIEETATTFSGNAALKSLGIAAWLRERGAGEDLLVLSDDSGICIDAFDGEPGVYSARFAGPEAGDEDNNAKMVTELQARGLEASAAHYACVLSLARVDGRPVAIPMPESGEGDMYVEGDSLCIEGHCFGEVRTVRQGEGGFGYDPYFWVDERARTFADLHPDEKARRSHRGAAMRLLMSQLSKILTSDPDAS